MSILKREELYKDIWSRPSTKIAGDLGISSSALKRICKAMKIPTPAVGYWTKVACGNKVKKARLPKASDDTKLEWEIDPRRSLSQRQSGSKRPTPEERESYPEVPIASNLDDLHPLVKKTRTQLREDWSNKRQSEQKVRKRLDVDVSSGVLDRSLLFLDALVRGIEKQGLKLASDMDSREGRIELEKSHYQREYAATECCWVVVGDEQVHFSLREKINRTRVEDSSERKYTWPEWEEHPSGKLELSIHAITGFKRRSTWRDGKVQRVEQFLGEIVASFPRVGEHMRLETIEAEERGKQWAIAEKHREEMDVIRQRFARQRWEEEWAEEKLMKDVAQHEKAESLRALHTACKGRIIELYGQPKPNSDLDLWLRWVEARADIIDPVQGGTFPWMHSGLLKVIGAQVPEE